jgi:hypothetical protein
MMRTGDRWHITEAEFKALGGVNWNVCEHCKRTIGYHYQDATGKMFCLRLQEPQTPPQTVK